MIGIASHPAADVRTVISGKGLAAVIGVLDVQI